VRARVRLLPTLLLAAVVVMAAARAEALDALVTRIVDGDTIVVTLGTASEKVRYIGVDTPELHHPRRRREPGAREAAAVNRDLVLGRHVRLELDVRTRDRYGRLLAYVWVGEAAIWFPVILAGVLACCSAVMPEPE